MDGVLIDLLNAKWKTFVKAKFYKQFFTFAFYFLITLICFTLRPGPPVNRNVASVNSTNATLHNRTVTGNLSVTLNYTSLKREIKTNGSQSIGTHSLKKFHITESYYSQQRIKLRMTMMLRNGGII